MFISKEDLDDIRDRLRSLELIVVSLCPHKKVVQDSYISKYYSCELCKMGFKRDEIPTQSIICEYKCKKKEEK